MRDYEILYIVGADLDEDKVQESVKKVNTLIEKAGGSPERTNLWGKRKLAYEVRHQKDGYYVLQDFKIEAARVPELEAALKITEDVFRHVIVRRPEPRAAAPAKRVAKAADKSAEQPAEESVAAPAVEAGAGAEEGS